MEKRNGFTLIEVLLSLVIMMIILLVISPFSTDIVEKKREEQFIEMLQADILLIQNLSMQTRKSTVIYFEEGKYVILVGNSTFRTREFPKEWKITDDGIRPLSFTPGGIIRRPGSLRIKMTHSYVKIVFPLGKGRGYVEQL